MLRGGLGADRGARSFCSTLLLPDSFALTRDTGGPFTDAESSEVGKEPVVNGDCSAPLQPGVPPSSLLPHLAALFYPYKANT